MLTPRNVIALTVTIAALSIVGVCISLMQPPDSGGLGADSYGTRARGHRGLFETLEELGVPTERALVPPTGVLDRSTILVLWAPDEKFVSLEPAYLKSVGAWIREGGRVVVAPSESQPIVDRPARLLQASDRKHESLLDLLGLEGVEFSQVYLDERGSAERRPQDRVMADEDETDGLRRLGEIVAGLGPETLTQTRSISVSASGTLSGLGALVRSIEIPGEELQVIGRGPAQAAGTVTFDGTDGETHVVVASYHLGEGELVVVGDPALAWNRVVAERDNSVLFAHLLAAPGRRVVFDEFYHGLTIRGNPFWLLTRRAYAVLALCVLAVAGVWLWRQAVFPGPPLEPEREARRTIGEYLEAMARFFNRGRSSRGFLVREVRDGVLRRLRQTLGLAPGRERPDEIVAALVRRDPQRAARLRDAVAAVDAALSRRKSLGEKETVHLLQRITDCLS